MKKYYTHKVVHSIKGKQFFMNEMDITFIKKSKNSESMGGIETPFSI